MPARLDLTNQRFGRLTALEFAGTVRSDGGNEFTQWRCRCDCGAETITYTNGLRSGHAQSCGCRQEDNQRRAVKTHGLYLSPAYRIWASMIQRCTNKKCGGYENYGGRGIAVCERWLKFKNFVADMGQRPDGKSIDRKDNDGNYEPSNCRWATKAEQEKNKRTNVFVTHDGRSQTIAEWCRELSVSHATIKRRLKVYGTLQPQHGAVNA